MRLSLVVPVLNEEKRIVDHLERLCARGNHQLIVVDGGSHDLTPSLARPRCDLLIEENGGLACQLNRGAEAATGDVLFFPYADTELPERWDELIEAKLENSRVVGGAFKLGFDSPRPHYRLISAIANLRTHLGFGPLGDQGIFVRSRVFERCGGFRSDVLLEDLDFARRLRKQGQVAILEQPVRTSVRRWEQMGVLRTTMRNWTFFARHLVGRGPDHQPSYRHYRTKNHGYPSK